MTTHQVHNAAARATTTRLLHHFIAGATSYMPALFMVFAAATTLLFPDLAMAAGAGTGTRFQAGADITEQEVKGSYGKMMVYLAIAVGMIFAVLMRQWLYAFGGLALIIIIQVSTATADASFTALL